MLLHGKPITSHSKAQKPCCCWTAVSPIQSAKSRMHSVGCSACWFSGCVCNFVVPAQTLVHLPFKEDLRTYQFPTFSSEKRPEIAPSEAQLSAARLLVQGVNLSQGVFHNSKNGTQSRACTLTAKCSHKSSWS